MLSMLSGACIAAQVPKNGRGEGGCGCTNWGKLRRAYISKE
jgi:hypothetical protein